jgi:TRAP transporter 4TM/12TM fusion protein
MGAAAFLMVQYTGTPFADIIVLATIPAIVFFFGVWVMVHLKAVQEGIGGIAAEETVALRSHLVRGWFYLVPIVLLLYYLIIARLSVARSAWFTLVALVALISVVAGYSRETRGVLAGTFLVIVGAQLVAYTVGGVGIVELVTAGGGAGLPPGEAAGVVLGQIGWYAIAAGFAAMLYRPGMTAPFLELDTAVQETAAAIGDAVGRPSLGDNQSLRVGTFVFKSMDDGARTAVPVVIAVAAAGIIPGVISVSGLGPNLTSLLLDLSAGSLVVMLVVTAVSSIILGMGMPTTVTYIILISMLAQPLVEFGLPLLAAHLFILYFGVIADITPPVAVAAYAASGVAKSDAFETGVKAFSLSLNKAIVPFAFVLVPGIVLLRETAPGQFRIVGFGDLADLTYSVPEIFVPVVGVFLGVIALGATVIGTLYTRVTRTERWAFAASSVLLMAPGLVSTSVFDVLGFLGQTVALPEELSLLLDLGMRAVGLVIFLVLALRNRRRAAGEATGLEGADRDDESPDLA